MPDRAEVLQKLKSHMKILKQDYFVSKIGLFGSFSRNEERQGSDIDILVEFSEPVGFVKFIKLEDYLEEILNEKIDLVTPAALKARMKPKIMQEVVYV